MTMWPYPPPDPGAQRPSRLQQALGSVAGYLLAAPGRAAQAKRQRAFSRLDDRSLRDLGLSRVDQWIHAEPSGRTHRR